MSASLVDLLLAEQASLGLVETFARRHDEGALSIGQRVFEERVPLRGAAGPGRQLAFRVDLDACTGCKACVTACHSLNGLGPAENWREVGLLVGEGEGTGFQQTVTTTCHHCEDPACLAGCPVRAYEKDPVTGIVRHLDDQCIGCQYCVLKCPYDAPKYDASLGIVRKCDMCTGRLGAGEAPACVQGCPNGAISIEVVELRGELRREDGAEALLPGLDGEIPDSAYTRPTTRYVSTRPRAARRPATLEQDTAGAAHDPLAVMLVLLQLSVGALVLDTGFARLAGTSALVAVGAAACALAGLGAATLHLGRPRYAFRAFLGWRTSWMSREILAFGAYVPLVAALAAVEALALPVGSLLASGTRVAALLLGMAGSVCSVMIYADTRRALWAGLRTAPLFLGTALVLGAFGVAGARGIAAWWVGADVPVASAALLALGAGALAYKRRGERRLLSGTGRGSARLDRTRRLLRGPLAQKLALRVRLARSALALAGLALATLVAAAPLATAGLMLAALVAATAGELVERHLYFRAESSPGMPGL